MVRFATKNASLSDIKEKKSLASSITATIFQYQTTREKRILK
jgi:hypothetical protein